MVKDAITLEARPRKAAGKKVKDLRKQKRIPGVLYGYKVENQPVECLEQEFHKVFVKAGESTVVDLSVEGKTVPVLIHHIAFEPISGNYAHIDFLALDMTKEVTTHVPIRTIGEAPGVKELGGVLVHNRDTLTVKCLPKDLPHAIEVDLSSLQNFHDTIVVSALKVPPHVTILEKAEEIVVSLQPPRKEEEVAPVAAMVPEGGVAPEGAAAAEGAPAAGAQAAPEPAQKAKEDKKGK
jgi:large subunit ribosomal protein L25